MKLLLYLVLFSILLMSSVDVIAQKKRKGKSKKTSIKNSLPFRQNIKSAEEIATIYNKFDRFKYQILGHFSNKEQSELIGNNEPRQEFIVMPIFEDRPGEFWVYLEFFSPSLLTSPIDQRVEQYVRISRDTFRMEVYYLKNPDKFINAWRKEVPPVFSKEDFIRGDRCDLLITHQESKPGTFRTIEPEQITCEMLTANGSARYVDLEFELSDSQYLMWFHFYTKEKELLKKSEKNGLVFKRLEGDESNHLIQEAE